MLLATAILLGVLPYASLAQVEEGLNIQGGVTIVLHSKIQFITNPLQGSDSLVSSLMPNPPHGKLLFKVNEGSC
jgi:hypothetical protein